jgi:hypothetical protein
VSEGLPPCRRLTTVFRAAYLGEKDPGT